MPAPNHHAPAANPPALDIRGLRFRFAGAGQDLLHIQSLVLDSGQAMLLSGGSGSGKSTLLQLIAGLLEPTAGSVAVAGTVMHALPPAARDHYRGRHIGMIFQTFNLLAGFTALENVMLALMFSDVPRRDHRSRADALLRSLGLADREIAAEPDHLSVGQQQRVAVARALACEPALVLADEPTASLDPENAAGAMDLIQSACAQHHAALLCTSHDPSMSSRFKHVVALRPNAVAANA